MISVIIIEDIKEIRESLAQLISSSPGFKCLAAYESAEEASKAFASLQPDVALVDIHLPGDSGIEFIRRQKPSCPSTQFLICSVFEDTENIFSALEAGATGYVIKSTPAAKLLDAIQEIHSGGSPMSGQIARKVVAKFQARKESKELEKLSAREQEILQLLSKGYRYKEIAAKLFISLETVRTHIRNIYEKLQVQSRTEAINKAYSK